MTTPLKQSLVNGTHPVGNWISMGSPAVPEVSAMLGFDFVLIDTEHTPLGLETVQQLVFAAERPEGSVDVVVRPPDDDPAHLKRILDLGVSGVMIPMVETAEQAREIVEAVTYPPEGIRGIAGSRATEYGRELVESVSDPERSVTLLVQIETETGLENVTDIAAVEGIDGLFVGPADLSGGLDLVGELTASQYLEAIDAVLTAAEELSVPVGTFAIGEERIRAAVEQGFSYLIVGKDVNYLLEGSQEAKSQYEAAIESVRPGSVE